MAADTSGHRLRPIRIGMAGLVPIIHVLAFADKTFPSPGAERP